MSYLITDSLSTFWHMCTPNKMNKMYIRACWKLLLNDPSEKWWLIIIIFISKRSLISTNYSPARHMRKKFFFSWWLFVMEFLTPTLIRRKLILYEEWAGENEREKNFFFKRWWLMLSLRLLHVFIQYLPALSWQCTSFTEEEVIMKISFLLFFDYLEWSRLWVADDRRIHSKSNPFHI